MAFHRMLPGLIAAAAAHVPSFKLAMAGALLRVSAGTVQLSLSRYRDNTIRKRPSEHLRAPRPRNTYNRETSLSRDAGIGPGWVDGDSVVHTSTYLT